MEYTEVNKILLVSDYGFGIKTEIILEKNKYSCEKFKEEYLIRMSKLDDIECILLHLYYEENDRYEVYDFEKTIVHDPLHNPVSEIVCAIIFNILNENNKPYMKELLSKIMFISQNPSSDYGWWKKYFENFDVCFIELEPGKIINAKNINNRFLRLNTAFEKSTFIDNTSKELEAAFKHHE